VIPKFSQDLKASKTRNNDLNKSEKMRPVRRVKCAFEVIVPEV
jgi:hypothetical protein